jgi:hypothetical protein
MDIDHEFAGSVRSWLRNEAYASADRILGEVLPGIAAVPQRRPGWTAWRVVGRPGDVAIVFGTAVLVVIVAVIGRATASQDDGVAAPTASATVTAMPSVRAFPPDDLGDGETTSAIPPGRTFIPWAGGAGGSGIEVSVPAGWGRFAGASSDIAIFKRHGFLYGFPVDLLVGSVTRIVTSVCPEDPASGEVGPTFVDPGPSVGDLVAGLRRVTGMSWSEPTAVTVGGYAAQRIETTFRAECPGPSRRTILEDPGAYFVEERTTTTVVIVDVDGRRLVLATHAREAATDEDRAELAAIIASATVDPGTGPMPAPSDLPDRVFPSAIGPDATLRVGPHRARIDGVDFTFAVADDGWEPQLGFTITNSTHGPQAAEGIVRFTTVPRGADTRPCPATLDPTIGGSARALVAAMAAAPGIEVLRAPQTVVVGGRAAWHAMLEVRTDVGCDPGYFSTYDPVDGGAMWTHTERGDRILVWIVDAGDVAFRIESELHADAGPRLGQRSAESSTR